MSQVNSINGNTLLFTGFFPPCRVATTAAIALQGLQTIDGIALNAGDRVLVKNQADATTNGIYAANSGIWVRTSDAMSNAQFYDGMAVVVSRGTVNQTTLWVCTTTDDPVIIGSSLLTFANFTTINSVSPAMQQVTQALTLALARTAMGLGSAATRNIGKYGLLDDGAGYLNAVGPTSTFSSGGKAITAADNNGFFIATGAAVMTLAQAQTLPSGFRFYVFTPAGATATLTPNAGDGFSGLTTGAAKALPPGRLALITTDGAGPGTWYASPVTGWQNVPVSLTSATPVTNAHKGATLQLGGGTMWKLTFPAGSTLDADFTCVIENIETGAVGKGIAGINVGGFTLYPGESYLVYNDSNTLKLLGGSVKRYKKAGLSLFVDNVNGSNDPTVADGLSTGTRAFASIGYAIQALYTLYDHNGSQPVITVANGVYNESVAIANGVPTGCASVWFINGASPQGVIWQPAGAGTPYCFLPGDGCIFEWSNIKLYANGISGAVGIQMHQSVIGDMNGGCAFAAFPSGTHIGTDGAGWSLNLNASYTVDTGSCNTHLAANSPGFLSQAGAVTVTINGTPTIGRWFQAVAGGMISLGSSITWSGSVAGGCQKWSVQPGSVMFCSGNSANIPGSTAGSPATGVAPTGSAGTVVA